MKKITSIIFSVIMLVSFSFSASAVGEASTTSESFNEYDYIQIIKESTPQELATLGVSEQEATEIISSFEDALSARASLSETELRGYGYDESEIALLHAYANGETLSPSQLRDLGSNCEGTITLNITWQDVSETYDCWMTDYRVLLPQAMPLPCLEKIYRSGSSPARYENHPCCWKQKIHPKALCPLSSNKAFVFVFGHIDTNRNNHPPNPPTINLRCWLYRTLYLVAAFHINRPNGISLINNTVKSCGWSFIETVLR